MVGYSFDAYRWICNTPAIQLLAIKSIGQSMSLNFKSFIKNKFLFLIFIPSIILMLEMIIFMTEEKFAQAAITLNPDNKETILLGKSVYIQNCASCHGAKLEGQKD